MNKVFRVIWSEAQGAWVAVSETTKSHSKRSRKHALALALTAGSLIGLSGQALATGEFVPAGEGSIAINSGSCGTGTQAQGEHSVSIGCGAGVNAKGPNGSGFADNDTSIGYQAGLNVEGKNNSAIGTNAGETVKGDNNTAFGVSAGKTITGNKNTSLGDNSGFSIKGDGNLSVGSESGGNVTGDHNVMLGKKATVKGSSVANPISDAVVVGYKASASKSNNVALGFEAKADHENSVALGSLSETRAGESVTEGKISYGTGPDTKTYTYSGFAGTASGVVSVGSKNAQRQIINVAPGAITDKSTDAINGSQLYGVAAGLNKRIDESGGWILGSKNTGGHSQDLTVAAGKKVTLDAGANMQVTSEQGDDGNTVTTFTTTPDVTHKSVTATDDSGNTSVLDSTGLTVGDTTIKKDGLTINGGPSVTTAGVNAGNLIISNVKAGIAATDGVNVSQLKGLGSVIGGVNIDNTTGAVTGPTFKVNQNSYTTIAGAIEGLNKGWTFTAGGETDQVQAGDKVSLEAGKNMLITSTKDADGNITSTFLTKDAVEFDSVKTGDSLLNNTGLTVGTNVSVTSQGFTAGDVSLTVDGINAGNKKITNVAAGTELTDGVNVSQLKQVQAQANKGWKLGSKDATNTNDLTLDVAPDGQVNLDAGKNMQVTSEQAADGTVTTTFATKADVKFDSVTLGDITQPGQYTQLTQGGLNIGGNTFVNNGGLTFNNSSVSVSANGINAGGNKIINVAKGEDDSDAVNVGQLKDYVGKNDGSWNISNGTTSSKVATGNTVTIEGGKTGTTAGNINVTHDGNGNLTIESNANVKHDNVTVGETTINKDTGITVGDTNINNQGDITVGDKVSVNKDGVTVGDVSITVDGGINAGDKKITGVADGTIAAGSKDAVNGGQIHDMQVQIDQQAGGWELNDGKGGKQQVKAGDSVAIVGGDNINVEFDADGKMVVETTPDVTHNSVNIESTDANGNIVKGPSMNKDGIDAAGNKVTGVADGTIAAGSKDAVNGGQIHDLEQKISEAGGWELSDGTTDKKVNSGDKVTIKGGDNIDVAINDDGDMIVKTNPDVTHDSVTTGDTVMNDNGLVVKVDDGKGGLKDGPSITKNGVDAGGKKVTGVADGDINKDSTDAVNGSQLDATNNRVTKNEGDITNLDNRVTKTEGDITNLDNRVTKTEGDITNLDNRVTKNEGDITNLDNRVTKNEGDITNLDNRVTKNEGDIENNAGDIENIQNGKDGMFQVSQDYNAPKPKPTGKKSAAGGAGAVASGDNSTAVGNDAQATASNSTALGNSAFASANNSVALGQGSVADRENSVSVGTVGGERQITNVAAGVAPTDAVNVSQLDALGSKVNQYFNAANKRIDKVDNNARAGIAAAMAAGTLPQSTLPGKSMVTVGASTYRGESALAIGVSRLSDNARTVIKANASADSRGNAGAAVGAGWHW